MGDAFPVAVTYCGNCGLPPEFCEYGVRFESCKPWLRVHAAHLYPQLASPPAGGAAAAAAGDAGVAAAADGLARVELGGSGAGAQPAGGAADVGAPAPEADGGDGADDDEKKKKKRGGQVARGGPKKREGGAVTVTVKDRGRRKYVTTIGGLDAYEHVKLKEAASALGKKFGAGASVTKSAEGKPEIDVQGDVGDDLPGVLAALYGIPEDAVVLRD